MLLDGRTVARSEFAEKLKRAQKDVGVNVGADSTMPQTKAVASLSPATAKEVVD
jgi:hypothetical protein